MQNNLPLKERRALQHKTSIKDTVRQNGVNEAKRHFVAYIGESLKAQNAEFASAKSELRVHLFAAHHVII